MGSDANRAEKNLTTRLTNNAMLRKLLNLEYYLEQKPQTFWGFDLFNYTPKIEIVHSESKCHLTAKKEGIFDILGYYEAETQTVNICEQNIFDHLKNEKESVYNDLLKQGFKIDKSVFFASLREVIRLHEHAHAIIDSCSFNCFSAPSHEWFVKLPPELGEPLAQFIVWSLLNTKDGGKSLLMETFKLLSSKQSKIYKDWEVIRKWADNLNESLTRVMAKVLDYQSLIPLVVRFSRTRNWKTFVEFERELNKLVPSEIMEALTFRIQSEAQRKVEYLKSFRSEKPATQEKDENAD